MHHAQPLKALQTVPVIPVLTIERLEDAVPVAEALVAGGLIVLEVTLRTPVALTAIEAIATALPKAVVGAGTLLRPADVAMALAAGAEFLVTPGTPDDLAAALMTSPVPVLPGCSTVTEAIRLRERGFRTLKFFPAGACGGPAFLRGIAGPLPDLTFCPTGGIDASNARDYLSLPNVVAVGGSWITPRKAVEAKDWGAIAALARQAMTLRPPAA
jgi:2-dehydro-3-deoxyphosphogluconate aldolase/(4S)-4-hydroxy-2-oxoglutarate aldolase